jgi:antitoxin component of RelBE/YafQ-DinJ toxin-antitoxin module
MENVQPFDVEPPNDATIAAIQEARASKLPSFRNVSELIADLNADD